MSSVFSSQLKDYFNKAKVDLIF